MKSGLVVRQTIPKQFRKNSKNSKTKETAETVFELLATLVIIQIFLQVIGLKFGTDLAALYYIIQFAPIFQFIWLTFLFKRRCI